MKQSGNLLTVCLFGSVARGDNDALSDLDLLAIVKSRSGRVSDEQVWSHLPAGLKSAKPTISWYGSDRFLKMSEDGTLFSWHIYLDGVTLYDPERFYSGLGEPAAYTQALTDVDAFIEIASGVPAQVHQSGQNSIYELGLLYVCSRNVAMSASAVLSGRPDFTRSSPYNIQPSLADFGVDISEYDRSMLCRLASQRGTPAPPDVDAAEIMSYYVSAGAWMNQVRQLVIAGG